MSWTWAWALALLGVPALLVVLAVATFRWKSRVAASLGDSRVVARLHDPFTGRLQRVKALLSLLGMVFLILALAGPRWGQEFQEVRRRGVDVVIAVDVSASMLAEDIKPNRLTQAKRELGLLIDGLQGDRVGVVAFAGTAFLQCPLTLDYGAARSILELVGPDLIPKPGTSLADALDVAVGAFPPGSKKHRAVVLLTDGEDHSGRLDSTVGRAAEAGVAVFAIGFGSPTGEIIPLRDESGALTGYKKDKEGQTVTSKMDALALEKMARETRGAFFPASQGEVEVDRVLAEIQGMEKKDLESRVHGQGENHYLWPLWIAFLLLLLEFLWPETTGHFRRVAGDLRARRWTRTAALLLLWGAFPPSSQALGRYPESRELADRALANPKDFTAQFELAHGLFNEKRFASSAEAFEKAAALAADPTVKGAALYNAGNALLSDQKLDAAIGKYKAALRENPADPDAQHNLELAQLKKKEQKKPRDGDKKPEPRSGQMSPEDAERLLQALAQQENEARKKANARKPQEPPAGNDW
jgi:Ca-activated chloride channel family protein